MTKRKRGTMMNFTSMLDVIFILLLFFVAASKLRDASLDVRLPTAEGKSETSAGRSGKDLTISVDREDRLFLNGAAVAAEKVLVSSLGTDRERRVVFVADRESHSGRLVGTLKTVTDAGFHDVSFLYQTKRENE